MPVYELTKRERLGAETFPFLIGSIPLRHQQELPDAVVSDVAFLVGGEDLLALKILHLDLEQEVRIGTEPQIVQNGFRFFLGCGESANKRHGI